MNRRLLNDSAELMARKCLSIVGPCLMNLERNDAFNEFYQAATDVLEDYHRRVDRMGRRLLGGKGDKRWNVNVDKPPNDTKEPE